MSAIKTSARRSGSTTGAASPSNRSIAASSSPTRSLCSSSRTASCAGSVIDPAQFDYGKLNLPANLGDLGFSGFRLVANSGDGKPFDFAIVQGATFFRAIARGQNFGAIARALTLKPADPKGEEFPLFRAFWLERPAVGSNSITVHGAASIPNRPAGAIRMTLPPRRHDHRRCGDDPVSARQHRSRGPRRHRPRPIFTARTTGATSDDIRPAVYESSGLQMLNGKGEWLWRPLQNPEHAADLGLRRSGSRRASDCSSATAPSRPFRTTTSASTGRPSLWIEPLGEWGQGSVQLLEIPTDAEINDNILAYWRPESRPCRPVPRCRSPIGSTGAGAPPERPPLATVHGNPGRHEAAAAAAGASSSNFTGETLGENPPADLKSVLTVGPGAFQNLRLWPYPERKTVRVGFELDPGNENACEMRLILEAGGKPISETWLYRWTP